jgi:hypothetical protein
MPSKNWLRPEPYLSSWSQDEDTAILPPREWSCFPGEGHWKPSSSTESAAEIRIHGLSIWTVGDSQEEALGARMRIPLEYRKNVTEDAALEGGVVPVGHYPKWLNVFSAISLALTLVGVLIFFRDITLGSALAAVGSVGVWIAGSLAASYRESRYGTGQHR